MLRFDDKKENGIRESLMQFHDDMMDRMEEMKGRFSGNSAGNYKEYGMEPEILIVDEFVGRLKVLEVKQRIEIASVVRKIVLLGNFTGFFLLLINGEFAWRCLEGTGWSGLNQHYMLGVMDAFARIAVNAVEKQEPKTPEYEGDGCDREGNIIFDTWICPCCETRYKVDYGRYEYCPNCGQTIDWRDRK